MPGDDDEQNGAVIRLPADISGEVDTSAVETLRVTGFATPRAVAGDTSGGCWVGDIGNGTVIRLEPTGSAAATLTGFQEPQALFVDGTSGDVYVADFTLGLVARFSSATTGEHGYADVANLMITDAVGPASIWVEPTTGNIYVADRTGDKVFIYDNAGGSISSITDIDDPVGIAYWINVY